MALQWNVRGYRARKSELTILTAKYQPYVVCLQETICPPNCPSFSSDYAFICAPPTRLTGWGGVAIAVLKDFPFARVPLRTSLQAIAVTLEIPTKRTYVSLYIPPSHENGNFLSL